jgi:hypothetical protein
MYYIGNTMNLKMLKATFAGLALSVSSFANAGLMNVSYLEITNTKGTWLQVAEVIAIDMFGNDMALASFAKASAPNQWDGSTAPENTIDGITAGSYSLGQIFHDGIKGSTLTITFNSLQNLSSIQIFGRTGCCSNRDIYNVSFFGEQSNNLQTINSLFPSVITDVPEPNTLAIFALVIMGLAARRFKKQS